MAYAPPRPTPSFLANVKPVVSSDPRVLTFGALQGSYVSKHSGGQPIGIVKVLDVRKNVQALLFRTPLNEDLDGARNSYAPPVSATNHQPKDGLKALDDIRNATDTKNAVFHDDPTKNTFIWTGVQSLPANAGNQVIDARPFLKDSKGNFPVFQPANSPTKQFYAPRTAMNGTDGQAVDPVEVPYASLSWSIGYYGDVELGDFGVAIRARTGAYTGFLYGDAGGKRSTSVGEVSRKTIRNLFGGAANDEEICFIVFPGTSAGAVANARLIEPNTRHLLTVLGQKFTNADEIAKRLIVPKGFYDMTFGESTTNQLQGSGQTLGDTPHLDDVNFSSIQDANAAYVDVTKTRDYKNILDALRRAGMRQT